MLFALRLRRTNLDVETTKAVLEKLVLLVVEFFFIFFVSHDACSGCTDEPWRYFALWMLRDGRSRVLEYSASNFPERQICMWRVERNKELREQEGNKMRERRKKKFGRKSN